MSEQADQQPQVDMLAALSLGQDGQPASSTERALLEALHTIRVHLGMEVAFISEFERDRRTFRFVDNDDGAPELSVGASDPLEEGYCQRVVDGRLPQLIPDATRNDAALELPVTLDLPIGAHVSVPIRLRDGSVYGTLCCFDRRPDDTLNERDLGMMRVFADFAARQIDRQRERVRARQQARDQVCRVLDEQLFHVVFQAIHALPENRVVGFEALARFTAEPASWPAYWFQQATSAGLRVELELALIVAALDTFGQLPGHAYLSLNASPETILSGRLDALLAPLPLKRLVLEITEHDAVDDYPGLVEALAPLRAGGLRLAIDDAGAGYASFRHILRLAPDLIKLDQSLTRGIDRNTESQALASALAGFADATGCKLVAEGIETAAELTMLKQLDIGLG